jgi:hypothetical protein
VINTKKYLLTKWNSICRQNNQACLGIEVFTQQVAVKIRNEEGVWQELLCNKYLSQQSLSQAQAKPTNSSFRRGITSVKQEFFDRGSFLLGGGKIARFWEDSWLGVTPSFISISSQYKIVQDKNVLVADVLCALEYNFQTVVKWG